MRSIRETVANALTRFKPRERTDRSGLRLFAQPSLAWGLLAGELHEDADRITVRLEVPGMETEDFDVQVLGLKLIVRGEKRSESRSESGRYRMLECAYGTFERVIDLPAEVIADKVKARYRRGVLHVELPKARRSEPRRLEVKAH